MPDEEFLVPREKILHPPVKLEPSKAALEAANKAFCILAGRRDLFDSNERCTAVRHEVAIAIDAAVAEERAAAEKMKAYLLRMGTRCGRLKAYLLRMGTRCGRLKAYLLRMGTRCGICPPGQRHEDCGDCERREIVAAYEKARGKEAGNG